jgi:hypothetical protein
MKTFRKPIDDKALSNRSKIKPDPRDTKANPAFSKVEL